MAVLTKCEQARAPARQSSDCTRWYRRWNSGWGSEKQLSTRKRRWAGRKRDGKESEVDGNSATEEDE